MGKRKARDSELSVVLFPGWGVVNWSVDTTFAGYCSGLFQVGKSVADGLLFALVLSSHRLE